MARRAELIEEYTERFANPYNAAERGYVDDVIDPRETRRVLVALARDAAHEEGEAPAAQARERAALAAAWPTRRSSAVDLARRLARRAGGDHRRRRGRPPRACAAAARSAASVTGGDAAYLAAWVRASRLTARRAGLLRGAVAPVGPHRSPRPGLTRFAVTVVHDAELMTVGPDEVVVTFATDPGEDRSPHGSATPRSPPPVRTTSPASAASSRPPSTRVDVEGAAPTSCCRASVTTLERARRAAAGDDRDRQRRALRRDRVRPHR